MAIFLDVCQDRQSATAAEGSPKCSSHKFQCINKLHVFLVGKRAVCCGRRLRGKAVGRFRHADTCRLPLAAQDYLRFANILICASAGGC